MVKRYHLYIMLGISIVLFVIGSFLDLKISNALYVGNLFGNIVSAFGLILGYATVSLFTGILFALALKRNEYYLKYILICIAVIGFLICVYLSAKQIVSVNGFNLNQSWILIISILIFLLIHLCIGYIGFKIGNEIKNDKMYIVVLILSAAIILSVLFGAVLLKDLMHRPRYRTVIKEIEGIEFHNWWDRFGNYKNYISDSITKEEFKSFPSGHATTSMFAVIGLSYLSVFVPKLKNKQVILAYAGFVYSLFVSYTRIYAGAHFLSDVSMGSIITLVFFIIANEIIIRKKLIEEEKDTTV